MKRLGRLLEPGLIPSLLYAGSLGQPSSAMGQCNPAKAIKIIDAELS